MAVDLYMTMLFVDQGMGNLITLTTKNDPADVKYNALIDFGTKSTDKAGPDTVTWVANILTNGGKKNAVLNLVVISHKDDDHWSLFPALNEAIIKLKKTLSITTLYYGDEAGNYNIISKKYGVTVIDYLAKLVTGNYYYLPDEASHYKKKPHLSDFAEFDGVRFVPVIGNVITSRQSSKDIVANTLSIVMAVLYKDIPIVLPGDATAETLAAIYELLEAGGDIDEIKSAFMLSVPHHGALRTLASNYKSTNANLNVATDFAAELDAWNVGASAGFENYGHPDEEVMDLFAAYAQKRPRAHDYVVFSRTKNYWVKKSTKEGIFTTYLTAGTNNAGNLADRCRIVFIVKADGKRMIGIIPVSQPGLPPK
jgi:hypothetical protein